MFEQRRKERRASRERKEGRSSGRFYLPITLWVSKGRSLCPRRAQYRDIL